MKKFPCHKFSRSPTPRWCFRLSEPLQLIYHRPLSPICRIIERRTTERTVYRTTVHLHQTVVERHIHQRFLSASYLHQDAFLLFLPQNRSAETGAEESARPSRTAQRLMRLFSKESVRRELRPFYSGVVRGVLREEQERYRSRPAQAIALIWNLFGRPQAFRTLTRFYMSAVEKLGSNYYPALTGSNALFLAAGVLLHSRTYRQYVRQFWRREAASLPERAVPQESLSLRDLTQLQVVRRIPPPQEAVERLTADAPEPAREFREDEPRPVRLSEADFQALVESVARSLGREARLEALRRETF